jgi:hypothetical protein
MTIDMAIVAAEVSRMVAPRRMQSALETFPEERQRAPDQPGANVQQVTPIESRRTRPCVHDAAPLSPFGRVSVALSIGWDPADQLFSTGQR